MKASPISAPIFKRYFLTNATIVNLYLYSSTGELSLIINEEEEDLKSEKDTRTTKYRRVKEWP